MPDDTNRLRSIVSAISQSHVSIYDLISRGSNLWIPSKDLETLLNQGLKGISLRGYPLRTRSKVVKIKVCQALGYPVPLSFARTHPRFPGQMLDTYIQKSNNLQVWNEELDATRRYAIIRVSNTDVIEGVKVVPGAALASLVRTGTLTQKYQARLQIGGKLTELVSPTDTENLQLARKLKGSPADFGNSPTDNPTPKSLLPIGEVFRRLSVLVGQTFVDAGYDQERNRGGQLHRLVCRRLGYTSYEDDGQFPDIRNQLLEVKLQTSPTIDLGLVRPDSKDLLGVPAVEGKKIRHCDVRYALFYGTNDEGTVTLTRFYLTTGEAFFTRFPQFQGKVVNKKLQIPLPDNFFG
jgi:hypothetical protein